MTTVMTFTDYDTMVITNENGKVSTFSFVNNMDIFRKALEQVAQEHLENICNSYENKLNKALDLETTNYAYCDYKQNVKELLQKNWEKVYAIVADGLR